jgi:hypothetical protein
MYDYSNYYIKLNNSIDYCKFEFKDLEHFNLSKIKMSKNKTSIIPVFKTINCIKDVNDNNYDCEFTEYSLRVCMREIID